MGRNINAEISGAVPLENQHMEIVERKGIGHPDSIADGLSESVSRALCKMYMERYDRVLHHNTDETQIAGGQSAPKFGGGEVLEPIYILLVGRAVTEVDGNRLPYRAVAIKSARDYLKKHFANLDIDMDIMLDCRINKGSVDLRAVYETEEMLANDTSFGVGFAPFTETETITKEIERYLYYDLKKQFPAIGEDVKVMSAKEGDEIKTTIAIAMVDKYVKDKDDYINQIQEIKSKVLDHAVKHIDRGITVDINTADDYDNGVFYLTVTGLSMENGDDGSVGRGNRCHGLITPYRPMSMEAAAGKNPITHVGKLYNILSMRVAEDIVKTAAGDIKEANVWTLSQIGKPIDEPKTMSIKIIPESGANEAGMIKIAKEVANRHLESISDITDLIIGGKIDVF